MVLEGPIPIGRVKGQGELSNSSPRQSTECLRVPLSSFSGGHWWVEGGGGYSMVLLPVTAVRDVRLQMEAAWLHCTSRCVYGDALRAIGSTSEEWFGPDLAGTYTRPT